MVLSNSGLPAFLVSFFQCVDLPFTLKQPSYPKKYTFAISCSAQRQTYLANEVMNLDRGIDMFKEAEVSCPCLL